MERPIGVYLEKLAEALAVLMTGRDLMKLGTL